MWLRGQQSWSRCPIGAPSAIEPVPKETCQEAPPPPPPDLPDPQMALPPLPLEGPHKLHEKLAASRLKECCMQSYHRIFLRLNILRCNLWTCN